MQLEELPAGPDHLAVYDVGGRRVAGAASAGAASAGPARADGVVRDALGRRSPTTRIRSGTLVAAVPLLTGERVTGVIRAEVADAAVVRRTHHAWLALAAAAVSILLLAILASVLLARRLAGPLERVAVAARRLGDGDFSVRAPRGAIREVDAVADALDVTASRLDDLITRERRFSADASHQLRTPLAALRLELETLQLAGGPIGEIDRAVQQVDRLQRTIDTLLSVARDVPRPDTTSELAELLTDIERRWRSRLAGAGRRLTLSVPSGVVPVRAGHEVIGEILDVLLEQRRTPRGEHREHRPADRRLELGGRRRQRWGTRIPERREEVFERRPPDAGGHGIGLALARSLAHAEGGRLTVTHGGSSPRVTLVLARVSER